MILFDIIKGDVLEVLNGFDVKPRFALTFLDPPFNQGKTYEKHDDDIPSVEYWEWMTSICEKIYSLTLDGGSIYFMQREKNVHRVLKSLLDTSWTFQNLIIWKKKTSAVPQAARFSKQYQVIAFATKGDTPRVFNKLKIDLPLNDDQKIPRENGVYVTDVWDDILELTSGFYAGDEAIRDSMTGERLHDQQSPIALLLRILLSSTKKNDNVLDPFAGTGTTSIVANQLRRNSINIDSSRKNIDIIEKRINDERSTDDIDKYLDYYKHTKDIETIWKSTSKRNGLKNFI